MGNYDLNVQRKIDKKMSKYGMVPDTSRELRSLSTTQNDDSGTCDSGCVRSMEYLQRIVKSLLRQMGVHSHNFGPGEAITIDLQAELKYDDYITLNKFMSSKQESDKYLYRIDEIMSNFIHVVEHSSSRFDFLENIIHFPAFYSLKFWIILVTCTVIGSLIIMLFVKAYNTRAVHIQLLYGFLIIFILSCVWTFSNMYEDKKAEIHAHMVQSNGLPPKDCDYNNLDFFDSIHYFFRVNILGYTDRCSDHYARTMTDPFWKVNPMQAISESVAFFMFQPLDYIGAKLGGFYTNFIGSAPLLLKPVMLAFAIFLTVLILYGPFRISTPLLTIEPAWRPQVPAIERHPVHEHAMIGHERIRNEIMERPDGPVVRSLRDATTDMDGFQDYLSDEGTDELEIIGPFAFGRFNSEESRSAESTSTCKQSSLQKSKAKTFDMQAFSTDKMDSGTSGLVTYENHPETVGRPENLPTRTDNNETSDMTSAAGCHLFLQNKAKEEGQKVVECITLPSPQIKIVKQELLRDALREESDKENKYF